MVKMAMSQKKKMPKSALKASPLASMSNVEKAVAGTTNATMVALHNLAISRLSNKMGEQANYGSI